MCLSSELVRPGDVTGRGEHAGFQWRVIHNGMGYRCGYIQIPKGHPWHGMGDEDIPCRVHGGFTFAEVDVPCEASSGADDAWWIGFDCAHAGDAPDPELPGSHRTYPLTKYVPETDVIRSQAYVEEECRMVCEAAAAATGYKADEVPDPATQPQTPQHAVEDPAKEAGPQSIRPAPEVKK